MGGISQFLPIEGGRGCRPAEENRRYSEGMICMAPIEAQWRNLHNENLVRLTVSIRGFLSVLSDKSPHF